MAAGTLSAPHLAHLSGRKHVKFPRSVEGHPQQVFVEEGAPPGGPASAGAERQRPGFYIWQHAAPRTLGSVLGPALLVLGVFGATLLPVAPYLVKLGVLYTAMALLALLFFLSVLRLAIFIACWIALGRALWLLPNLYSDDVPITAILRPLWGEEKGKPGDATPGLAKRLSVCAVVLGTAYSLYCAAPDSEGLASNLKGANQSLLEMLNLHEAPKSIAATGNTTGVMAARPAMPSFLTGQPPPPPTAATAAAAAIARGAAGPAGVAKDPTEPLDAEKLANLAPIPEECELEDECEGPSAPAAQEERGAGEAEAPAAEAAAAEAPAVQADGASAGRSEETAAEL